MKTRRQFVAIVAGSLAARAGAKEPVSDDLLYDRVNRKIVNDHQLKTNALKIEVKDRVVTVSGLVETEKLKKRVSKVVKGVDGVKKVVNQVRVRR